MNKIVSTYIGILVSMLFLSSISCKKKVDEIPPVLDRLKITEVVYPISWTTGETVAFDFYGTYVLNSQPAANLIIGLNNEDYSAYSIVVDTVFKRGKGSFHVQATTTVVDWGSVADFKLYASLRDTLPQNSNSIHEYANSSYVIFPKD